MELACKIIGTHIRQLGHTLVITSSQTTRWVTFTHGKTLLLPQSCVRMQFLCATHDARALSQRAATAEIMGHISSLNICPISRQWVSTCNYKERKGYKTIQGNFSSGWAQMVKNLPATQESQVRSLGQEDPLEKEKATHSSILAWRIPWTEEPGRLSPWALKESDRME